MLQEKNKTNSIFKWKRIVEAIKKGMTDDTIQFRNTQFERTYTDENGQLLIETLAAVYGDCGFCVEHRNKDIDDDENPCEKCPLYIDSFCVNSGRFSGEKFTHFWKILQSLEIDSKQDWKRALELSEELLERIEAEPVEESNDRNTIRD